ncbi:hypothetical protein IV203_031301 [Nitzschia inconspicua]|uniref:Uncharacterized protein n=1 Tax=Nitzschia inconspicua TaxID=303405 RepID=A0A9K3LU32_9STRA|nr:hypothetical protein IV203_031301 [Nitzschia inconspicua]
MHEILQVARHRPRKAQELKHSVQSVQESDIMKAGGTCNRLYQLLMEGKRYGLFDGPKRTTYFPQGGIRRMFSGPENKSEDLSEVLQDNLMPLGTIVILQDLEQRPDLNGESGKHMGIGEHGRHNIQLSDGCFALKLEFSSSHRVRLGKENHHVKRSQMLSLLITRSEVKDNAPSILAARILNELNPFRKMRTGRNYIAT